MLFKYCGIIGLLVNIPITICITVIPPLPSPPLPPLPPSLPTLPLPTLPLSPPSLSPPRPLPTLSPHPPSVPSTLSLPHPPFPSLPSLQQIHCPFQPKQSPSYYYFDFELSRFVGDMAAENGVVILLIVGHSFVRRLANYALSAGEMNMKWNEGDCAATFIGTVAWACINWAHTLTKSCLGARAICWDWYYIH